MANKFLTTDVIAKEALLQLRNNAVMSKLVHRDYSNEFVTGVGDTITIRKPATFEAKEFTDTITVQDATEQSDTIKMDKHLDVSFAVTSKDLSMNIQDFSEQLLIPAMQAFNDKIDKYLIDLQKEITQRIDVTDGTLTKDHVIDLREFLTDKKAPNINRSLVVGAKAEADFLKIDQFISAEKVGDNGTALREASLGRKYGFNFFTDQNIAKTSGESPDYIPSIAFQKNAFALVTRPLALPISENKASIESYDGYGLRVVYGYDMNKKTDTISIDMLCGVKVLDKNLAAVLVDKRA